MQSISFQEALENILRNDHRYHREAYAFIREALELALKQRKKNAKEASRHVSAGELLSAFQQHALKEFGPMTVTVFDYWGVKNTEDVGNLVFNLISAGVFRKTEEDTREAFRDGFDFEEVFVKPFLPSFRGRGESLSKGANSRS